MTTTITRHRPAVAPVHPPESLLNWLSEMDVRAPVSGQSLKFIRARVPVARIAAEPAEFQRLNERFSSSKNAAVLHASPAADGPLLLPHEIKFLLEFPDSEAPRNALTRDEDARAKEAAFHCIVFDAGAAAATEETSREDGPIFTIDRLRFDAGENAWTGDEQGLADLEAGILRRADGPAGPLSAADIVRITVLTSMLDFSLDEALLEDLRMDSARPEFEKELQQLGRRFLGRQFKKLICGAKPSRAFLYLDEIGLLQWFLPELAAGRDLSQNRYHKHDIFFHSIYSCDAVDGPNLPLRLSALFHDLGKVDTRRVQRNGEATFHNHEVVSTKHTDRILKRFGFPPQLIKHVKFLVRNHMFHYTSEWTDRAVRRFVRKVAPEALEDLITLRLADRKGSGKHHALPRAIKDLMRHIERIRAEEAELKIRNLRIDGHGLMELGMKPGPRMGDVLQQLLDLVKADELENEAETLRAKAKELIASLERMGGQK